MPQLPRRRADALTLLSFGVFVLGFCLADLPANNCGSESAYRVDSPLSDGLTDCVTSVVNARPVIGVLAQDYYGKVAGFESFIAASYVKWLEGGGARVMPIFVNRTEQYYDEVLGMINGVLFPGEWRVYVDGSIGFLLSDRC